MAISAALLAASLSVGGSQTSAADEVQAHFARAEARAALAGEGFARAHALTVAWLARADPTSGLLPRNLDKDADLWTPRDSGGELFGGLALVAAVLDPPLFEERMQTLLAKEARQTARLGALPDTWSFSRRGFLSQDANADAIVFGAAAYAERGLLGVVEWKGPGPFAERLLALADGVLDNARFDAPGGRLPLDSYAVNGRILSVLVRAHRLTGDARWLDAAQRIGDYYLLSGASPARADEDWSLRDGGQALVAGLGELYAHLAEVRPERAGQYRPSWNGIVSRLLQAARDEHGLFTTSFDPVSGEHPEGRTPDFGAVCAGLWSAYRVDGNLPARDAVLGVLANLPAADDADAWGGTGAADRARAIESALSLAALEGAPPLDEWLESNLRALWKAQGADGLVDGRHTDGAFARASLAYALWLGAGVRPRPWREDVAIGADVTADGVWLVVRAERPWRGRLVFDRPRERDFLGTERGTPRTEALPERFAVDARATRSLRLPFDAPERLIAGSALLQGLLCEVGPEAPLRLFVAR